MKAIWKYTLKITDEQSVKMPRGAKILSTASQDGSLCVWAEVDPSRWAKGDTVDVAFAVVGTGNPMSHRGSFVGTVVMSPFVWHVYAEPAK